MSNGDELECICSKAYRPVCTVDVVTHKNACHARCQKTRVECRGQCPCRGGSSNRRRTRKTAQRSTEEDEEEGSQSGDGRTETVVFRSGGGIKGKNRRYYRTLVKNEPRECACQRMLAPVCGSDGKTKSNKCMAACHGVEVDCQGTCPCKKETETKRKFELEVALLQLQQDLLNERNSGNSTGDDGCSCPPSVAPVCTESDMTFSSECRAECREQKVKCRSVCPCPEKDAGDEKKVKEGVWKNLCPGLAPF